MAKVGPPKKKDRHPHEDKRPSIRRASAIGIPTKDIAHLHGMTPQTLHKHYQEDLDLGASEANMEVGGVIFEAARRGDPWAAKIWAAKRLGWRDTPQAVELTGKDGGAIETKDTTLDAAKLSSAALEEILAQRRN